MTSNTFKKRFYKQKTSFKDTSYVKSTERHVQTHLELEKQETYIQHQVVHPEASITLSQRRKKLQPMPPRETGNFKR
jgi:hypothetical protein